MRAIYALNPGRSLSRYSSPASISAIVPPTQAKRKKVARWLEDRTPRSSNRIEVFTGIFQAPVDRVAEGRLHQSNILPASNQRLPARDSHEKPSAPETPPTKTVQPQERSPGRDKHDPDGPAKSGPARRSFLLRCVQICNRALEHFGGHHHRFAQGRVRVDGQADVLGGRTHLDGQTNFADEISGVHADDAAADDSAGFFVEDQFREPFGAIHSQRTTAGGPGELADAEIHALVLGLALGNAGPGDFGIGVGHRRYDTRIGGALFAG